MHSRTHTCVARRLGIFGVLLLIKSLDYVKLQLAEISGSYMLE